MLEAGLQQRLIADAEVALLLDTRIYPVTWPDVPVKPMATYQRVSTVTTDLLSGPLSMATVRMQIDAWADTYGEVKALAEAILTALEGFQGTLPNGVRVDNITLDSSFDLYDSPSATYRVQSDFFVTFFRT